VAVRDDTFSMRSSLEMRTDSPLLEEDAMPIRDGNATFF
jgi:hypothetical protein